MLKSLAKTLAGWSHSIFGSPHWTPAPWMSATGKNIKAKPKKSLFLLLLLLLLAFFAKYAYQLYVERPQPISFDAIFVTPEIPGLNSKTPSRLDVRFTVNAESLAKAKSRSEKYSEYQIEIPEHALRLNKSNKELVGDISITPHVEGKWQSTENAIYFTPTKNWPANTDYEVTFSPDLFIDNVSLSAEKFSFSSQGFEGQTGEDKLHSDPQNPSELRFISTFTFTHPIDADSLKEKYKLFVQDDSGEYRPLDYTLTQDAELTDHAKRLYYINSAPVEITNATRYLRMQLDSGLKFAETPTYYSRPASSSDITGTFKEEIQIPSSADFFKVSNSNVQIVRDDDNNPQQALIFELSDSSTLNNVKDALEVYLLPMKYPARPWDKWSSPSEISPAVEEFAERLSVDVLPIENETSQIFSLIFDVPEDRQIFLRFKEGAESSGGYTTAKDFRALHHAPEYPKEVEFMGVGSVLDRSGEHQVGFVSRGVERLRVSIGQVRIDHINHLITQTNGNFRNPNFNYSISPENISVIDQEIVPLSPESAGKASYASIDLTEKLNQGGLFYIQVNGEDRNGRNYTQAKRIILVTDIGFLSKVNADRSQEVFVQSISSGYPMSNAKVSVLAKNGLPVFVAYTNARGHAQIPDLNDLRREKRPIAILVERDNNLAYLPINQYDRRLNASRFETGGVYWNSSTEKDLRAFLFTDRGIYRPGETVQMGAVVREFDLKASETFPVELSITDPRGVTVYEKKHRLPRDGFFEAELETFPYSSTGVYQARLTLLENRETNTSYQHLGAVNFSVEEFQADRLKIKSALHKDVLKARSDAKISDSSIKGWLNPGEVNFSIDLQNLFGTPAQDRKITADYRLNRQDFGFAQYKGYRFSDDFDYQRHSSLNYQVSLEDQRTDKQGHSNYAIDLDDFIGGTYQLNFNTKGYEENGGRSVQTRNRVLFSPREYLIGYKVEENLNYLKRHQEQSVALLCINRFIEKRDCNNLTLRITEKKYVSTLVKQRNGTYQYQSIQKDHVKSNSDINIDNTGYTYTFDTSAPGRYLLEILDQQGELRQEIEYQVVGAANLSADLEQDSQLEVVLDKNEYAAGEWIELQIKAPYTGSGLVSIESTNTHHFEWFKTDSTQSTQRIQVPDGLQGNAYVQIAFVRAPDSREIFTAPLSYAIAPFKLSRSAYQLDLELEVADKVEPGKALTINYRSAQKARIAIFAVDEGILQVAKYQTPKPLNHFLQKRALQVNTYQMFDLLLPEFELMRELSAAGGGMEEIVADASKSAKNLNPFARVVKDPVAFWSGIIEAGPEQQQVSYQVPDHFDGSLRVMAVAVSEERFAHAQNSVIVRGPFIVSPNAPTVVAPGDTFDVVVGVSNQLEDSGDTAQVQVSAKVSEHLEIISASEQTTSIPEGDEKSLRFTLKANSTLGSADMTFIAEAMDSSNAQRKASESLSVRPATLLTSTIQSGRNKEGEAIIPLSRDLLSDKANVQLFASADPSLLVNGLISYLDVFPHACTEQIVSQITPMLAFVDHPNYLGTPKVKTHKLESLFQGLRQRQLSNGGFALWPGGNTAAEVPTVHALHTMLDAAERNISVPAYVTNSGLDYLKEIAYDPDQMHNQPELVAYSLYLLTRSGEQTNNALIQLDSILMESATEKHPEAWKTQLVAAYMASSYQLLKRQQDASRLIRKYKFKNARSRINRYDSALYRDAMAMYLLARHFPDEFKQDDTNRIEAIIDPILSGNMNTLSSGRALLALRAYSDLVSTSPNDVQIDVAGSKQKVTRTETKSDDWAKLVLNFTNEQAAYPYADLDFDTQALRINSSTNSYYQTTQVGFDRLPPTSSVANGLEVTKVLYDTNGKQLSDKPKQGDDVIVKLSIRSTDNQRHDDIVIIDLLPGGFEIDRPSVRDGQNWNAEYIDIREDRLVYYGSVGANVVNITYKARLTSSGEFVVPAVYANAMYDDKLHAHSAASKMTVVENR